MNCDYIKRKHFDTIDSTQVYARNNLDLAIKENLFLITASEQTAGVGRSGDWVSPASLNIYATFMLKCSIEECKSILELSQITALSVFNTLKKYGIVGLLKWKNDVLVEGKKISGNLVEFFNEKDGNGVISLIGIGLNVNSDTNNLSSINQAATSMKDAASKEFIVEEVLGKLETELCENIIKYFELDYAAYKDEIEKILAYKDKHLCIENVATNTNYCGKLLGLGDLGGALLEGIEQEILDGSIDKKTVTHIQEDL